MSESSQIWIVTETETPAAVEGERGIRDIGARFNSNVADAVRALSRKRTPVDAAMLKAQMNGLLKVVGELFEQAEQQTGMPLKEVELSVEINAEGKVSLVGSGGSIGNKGGITLKFAPRQSG